MLALLIVAAVLVYIFVGVVVYNVRRGVTEKNCVRLQVNGRCRCEHEVGAGAMGVFWPLMPFFSAIYYAGVGMDRSGKAIARRFVK